MNHFSTTRQSLLPQQLPLRITLIYIVIGILWIIVSDSLLEAFVPDLSALSVLQTFKGWFFVFVTAGLLYTLIRRDMLALQESEQRFRSTFEQAAVGLAHSNPEGQYLRVNQKLCDILGYSRTELAILTFRDISHPDDLQADLARYHQLQVGAIANYSMEKRAIRKDHSVIWINQTVSLVREPDGEPKYLITVIEDITANKLLERQFLQAQKMEAVGRLAGGMAHDFNNLLTVINGYAELLLHRHLADPASLQRDIEQIQEAGERASTLTRQLLAFSRQQFLEAQILDLSAVVTNLETMLHRLIGEDIVLTFDCAEDLGSVKVDPGQMEQVIMNLVVNARDAMPHGGQLTIELANVELAENYSGQHIDLEPGLYVMLAVSDTGHGMDDATQAKIFEPFFTTKDRERGTGLGLAMVYGIVKQSGGHIKVYSEPGFGTSFKIYLPRTDEVTQPASASAETPEVLRGTETILVVEDSDSVREFIRTILAEYDYTVLAAGNGAEALSVYNGAAAKIDLVLTDVVMPGLSGGNLVEQLTAREPNLPVIYMSGYTDRATAHHNIIKKGTHFIQKPFTPISLARKIRQVFETERR